MDEDKEINIFILAGGFGTRLGNVLDKNTPKPMAKINGRPFLEYKISEIRKYFLTSGGRNVFSTGENTHKTYSTTRSRANNVNEAS